MARVRTEFLTPEEKEVRRKYHRDAAKRYREYRRERQNYDMILIMPKKSIILAKTWDAECCSFFGCGKTLTPTEKLFGNTCSKHNGEKKVDIMNVLKYK